MLFDIFFFLVICMLLWVTICKKEAYPFSWYPMYSKKYDVNDVCVFRLGLEYENGEVIWWSSKFYRYPEFIGLRLKFLHGLEGKMSSAIFTNLEREKLLLDVLKVIRQEEGLGKRFKSFHVIERRLKKFNVHNETLAIIPVEKLKNGQFA